MQNTLVDNNSIYLQKITSVPRHFHQFINFRYIRAAFLITLESAAIKHKHKETSISIQLLKPICMYLCSQDRIATRLLLARLLPLIIRV